MSQLGLDLICEWHVVEVGLKLFYDEKSIVGPGVFIPAQLCGREIHGINEKRKYHNVWGGRCIQILRIVVLASPPSSASDVVSFAMEPQNCRVRGMRELPYE